jgi:hypothetical protein
MHNKKNYINTSENDGEKFLNSSKMLHIIVFYVAGSIEKLNFQTLVDEAIRGYDYSEGENDFTVEHAVFAFTSEEAVKEAVTMMNSAITHIGRLNNAKRDCFYTKMTEEEYEKYKNVRK